MLSVLAALALAQVAPLAGGDAGSAQALAICMDGDEVRCFYCGQEFRAAVSDAGRLRLKAV